MDSIGQRLDCSFCAVWCWATLSTKASFVANRMERVKFLASIFRVGGLYTFVEAVAENGAGLCPRTFNPLPDDKFLDSSKLKEFADDNFKFDENGRKLSKRLENTVGKGEIARYEQFLLFPQWFQKACSPGASKGVIVWEWFNAVVTCLLLPVVI